MKTLKRWIPYKVKDKKGKVRENSSIIVLMEDRKVDEYVYSKYVEVNWSHQKDSVFAQNNDKGSTS